MHVVVISMFVGSKINDSFRATGNVCQYFASANFRSFWDAMIVAFSSQILFFGSVWFKEGIELFQGLVVMYLLCAALCLCLCHQDIDTK